VELRLHHPGGDAEEATADEEAELPPGLEDRDAEPFTLRPGQTLQGPERDRLAL
jgi:hypothetical protein